MLPTTYIIVLSLAFLSGITTIIGVALAIFFKKKINWIVGGIGFSVGIMLLISFFELIPESIGVLGISHTLIATLCGVLLLAFLNFIIPHTHLFKEKGKLRGPIFKTAYLVAFGLILHDFPEGFAMANSYIHAPMLGILITVAIALHNIPEEFAMAVPLVLTKSKSFLYKAAFISGLAEPAGALFGLFAVCIWPGLNSFFMAFAAGAMIFVSIHELIPMANKYKKPFMFVVGIGLSIAVYVVLGMFFPGG